MPPVTIIRKYVPPFHPPDENMILSARHISVADPRIRMHVPPMPMLCPSTLAWHPEGMRRSDPCSRRGC